MNRDGLGPRGDRIAGSEPELYNRYRKGESKLRFSGGTGSVRLRRTCCSAGHQLADG
jgi:hypothetical protein